MIDSRLTTNKFANSASSRSVADTPAQAEWLDQHDVFVASLRREETTILGPRMIYDGVFKNPDGSITNLG